MRNQITLRQAGPQDAEALIALMKQLDDETDYLLYESGERPADVKEWRRILSGDTGDLNRTFFVAEIRQSRLAGYLEVRTMDWKKVQHRAYFVIGIRKEWSGKGLGSLFLEYLERWARERNIRRIWLTVIADNQKAVRFYEKAGYVTEGKHPRSIKLGEHFVDELTMGKWLDAQDN